MSDEIEVEFTLRLSDDDSETDRPRGFNFLKSSKNWVLFVFFLNWC